MTDFLRRAESKVPWIILSSGKQGDYRHRSPSSVPSAQRKEPNSSAVGQKRNQETEPKQDKQAAIPGYIKIYLWKWFSRGKNIF